MGWLVVLGFGGDYTLASRHIVTILEAVWRAKRSSYGSKYAGRPIYIICNPDDPGHWTNPTAFRDTLTQYLDRYGFPYTVLDTYDKIYNTIFENPPSRAIFINTHGEGHPIPPQFGTIYDTSINDFTSDYKTVAKNYYKELASRAIQYEWVLIEPIGYAFFNAMQHGHDTAEKGAIGGDGLNSFLSVIGKTTDCFSGGGTLVCLSCALRFLWRYDEWGDVKVSIVRQFNVRTLGWDIVTPWFQVAKRSLFPNYVAGAIALEEPEGAVLWC